MSLETFIEISLENFRAFDVAQIKISIVETTQ